MSLRRLVYSIMLERRSHNSPLVCYCTATYIVAMCTHATLRHPEVEWMPL